MTAIPAAPSDSMTGVSDGGSSGLDEGSDHKPGAANAAGTKGNVTVRPEEEPKAIPWTTLVVLGIGLGTGLLAAFLFAWRADDRLEALGSAVIFSAAAVMSGGALGFLFGVPKASAQPDPSVRPPEGSGQQPTDYQLNTNLQQISDWLTRVIVGVALTQLGTIRNGASDLFDAMAPALGGTPESAAFAGGMTVYFSVFGFLMGWLAASLTLPLYLSRMPALLRRKN